VYNPFGGGSHIDDRKRNRSKRIEKFLVRFPIPKLPLFFLLSSSAFFFSFYFIRLNDYIYTHITGSVIDGIFLFFYLSIVDCVCRPHWILKVSAVGPWIILSFSHLSRRQPQPHH
jgi:hypothetical protein